MSSENLQASSVSRMRSSFSGFKQASRQGRSLTWGPLFAKLNDDSKLNVYSLHESKTTSFHDSVIYAAHDDNSSHYSNTPDVNIDKEFEEDVFIDWYDVELSGLWGYHGLVSDSWYDDEKPFVNVLDYSQFELTENEEDGILSHRIVYACSSYLDRCPETRKYVLCKFNLRAKMLMDISILSDYQFCQYLDLSENQITDLSPLGQLPFLMYLDVSHNEIDDILNFQPPLYLTHVNFSFNYAKGIPDLTDFWSIVFLDLSHNFIETIEGLRNLRYLRYLNLSYNRIKTVQNLDGMRIQNLDLNNNNIDSFEETPYTGFKTLPFLKHVNLSFNNIKSLRIFREVEQIQNLIINDNNIQSLLDMYYLRDARFLSSANFSNNPVAELEQYNIVCLDSMRFLVSLDNEYVSPNYRNCIRTLFDHGPESIAAVQSSNLMFLKQLNNPLNEYPIFKFSSSPPSLLVLVGPRGSNKHIYTQLLCKNFPKHTCLGVSHTTRPMLENEQNGISYHFINDDEFKNMVRDCKFITISEGMGYKYGLAKSELDRVYNEGILVLHTDLNGALVLKSHGLMPALVLALPRNLRTHLDWLKNKYFVFHAEDGIVRIGNNSIISKYDSKTTDTTFEGVVTVEVIVSEIIESMLEKICKEDVKRKSRCSHDYTRILYKEDFGNRRSAVKTQEPSGIDLFNNAFLGLEKPNVSAIEKKKLRAHFIMDKRHMSADRTNQELVQNYEMDEFGKFYPDSYEEVNEKERKRMENMAIHILSSKSIMNIPLDDKYASAEKLLIEDPENVENIFYQNILNERDEYLNMHWNNPGLFCRVIFTDERGESMSALKEVIHNCVENQATREPMYNVENDPLFKLKARRALFRVETVCAAKKK